MQLPFFFLLSFASCICAMQTPSVGTMAPNLAIRMYQLEIQKVELRYTLLLDELREEHALEVAQWAQQLTASQAAVEMQKAIIKRMNKRITELQTKSIDN